MIYLCETGPLVAYLNRNDQYRNWAVALFQQLRPPLLLSEAILTETIYFLREDGLPLDSLLQLMDRDLLRIDFALRAHRSRVIEAESKRSYPVMNEWISPMPRSS